MTTRPATSAPDWLENVFSWTSGALVVALLAHLLWDATREDRPAAFDVRVGVPTMAGTAVHVPVTVRNTGDRAVQQLEVTVTLTSEGAGQERTITFDWLAGESSRHGVAVFPRGAPGARATAEVSGFAEP